MKLWSYHGAGFSLTSGVLDSSLSSYAYIPTLRACYEELARRLRLPQYEIVWCHVRLGSDFPTYYSGRMQWELEVAEREFLAILDSCVWDRILGTLRGAPISLLRKWRREASKLPHGHSDYVKEKIMQYENQPPPLGDWWSSLFCDLTAEGATVLLRHPIPESWVVSKTLC